MSKQTLIASTITFVILSALVWSAYYFYEKTSLQWPLIIDNSLKNKENMNISIVIGRKTYLNTQFHYAIDYPSNWLFTEYPNAVGGVFYSLDSQDGNSPGSITVSETGRALDDCGIPFSEYMKIVAMHNIQNYDKLSSLAEVVTKNNIIGYTSTWLTSNLQDIPNKLPTPPMTYFEDRRQACGNGIGMVEIILNGVNNSKNIDINVYNQMVSSFHFTK